MSEFSGSVTFAKDIAFSAAKDGKVKFTGSVTGTGNFTMDGEGVVQIPAAAVLGRKVTWDLADKKTGTLGIDGDFDLANLTGALMNVPDIAHETNISYTLLETTGSLMGVVPDFGLPCGWNASLSKGKFLCLSYMKPGFVIIFR